MDYKYTVHELLCNDEISKGVYKLTVKGEFNAKPGQFYMLRAWRNEPVLSRPISVNDVENDRISFVYQVVGKGTEILASLKAGNKIELLGALGNSFNTDYKNEKIALVAGGIGIAPMLYLAKELKECKVDLYAGFRDVVFVADEIKGHVDNMYISTESGRNGEKGYVTDLLNPEKYDKVLCCGPEVMMEKVVKMCREKNVQVYVSMEKHMACGIGACLVCTCKTVEGNKRTCKDGPIFSGDDLVL